MHKQRIFTTKLREKNPKLHHSLPHTKIKDRSAPLSDSSSAMTGQATSNGRVVQLLPLSLQRTDRLDMFAKLAQTHGNRAMQNLQVCQPTAGVNPTAAALVQRKEQNEKPSVIGYVGLNPQARKEANALKNATPDEVIISLDDPKAQKRLKTDEGIESFVVGTLGITLEENVKQYNDAINCLKQSDPRFREQMAEMMEMFHGAELGQYRLERLVLSGHHSGGTLWRGRPPDIFQKEAILSLRKDLNNLVKVFPEAREQVEDVMFSACNTEAQIDLCKELFPNLRSVWAYSGASPSIAQGSDRHITKWERKTRDGRLPGQKDETGHILIWTKESMED